MPKRVWKRLENVGELRINKNKRLAFNIVETDHALGFQLNREIRRDSWPEFIWKPRSGGPILTSEMFEALMQLIIVKGDEILEKIRKYERGDNESASK